MRFKVPNCVLQLVNISKQTIVQSIFTVYPQIHQIRQLPAVHTADGNHVHTACNGLQSLVYGNGDKK